ncbi:lipopolysaccharide biosynthesis protein [Arcobacter sp. YIC-310]|uniref:lipopolysaccharide biosynthesis protein n=1 Tax=Arcobacter sp. YIC-310 TaxID=3376632 RepID=UPI003C20FEC6
MLKNLSDHKKYVLFSYLTIASNILTGFVLIPLILKYIGLAALGVFGLLFSLKSIIDIGIGWLSGSITKNLLKYKYIKPDISTLSFIVNMSYGLISVFIIWLYGYISKEDYFLSFIYFGLFTFLSFSLIPFYEILISNLKQYQTAFFRFLQQFLFMIFSISSFVFLNLNTLSSIFLSLLISVVLVYIIVFLYFNINIKVKLSKKNISKKMIKKLFLTDGIKYFINGISTILLLQIDVILIDYLYGSENAGIYLLIWKIPNTIIMLGWRISEPLQATIAKNIKKNKEEIYSKFCLFEKKVFILSIIIAALYTFLGEFILNIWLGSEKVPYLKYMYIISSFVIILSIMQRVYLSVNYYTYGLNNITILQFIELAFKIVFIVLFFNEFKELAPIIGWLIGFLFTFYFYRLNSLKIFKRVVK